MTKPKNSKAVVLLSGGLDSATTLYFAIAKGYRPTALIFHYGQRHQKEILAAKRIARLAGCPYKVLHLSFPWKGSSLVDHSLAIAQNRFLTRRPETIPLTYVPSRNIIFLSFAASFAEVMGAQAIFIGANAIDYSGYPDCRPKFLNAFQRMLSLGTKAGVQKKAIKIYAPFARKTKKEIICLGMKLRVPYHATWSCYQGHQKPCGVCDSCRLRQKGFSALKMKDPALS
jgi:7-cyano-7-deazaguanine synthase